MRLRGMLPLLLVPILPLWAGCVIYEESEERVQIDAERGIARHTVTEFNIESAETTAQAHGVDFRSVIEEWNGDEFLLGAAESGSHVLSRRLWLENGKLNSEVQYLWRVRESDEGRLGWYVDSLGFWTQVDTSEFEIVRTNGTASMGDSSLIVRWPPSARDLFLRQRAREFRPTSSFADSFQAYLRDERKRR